MNVTSPGRGIFVHVSPEASEQTKAAAKALDSALNEVSISCVIVDKHNALALAPPDPNTIIISVTARPFPVS